MYTIRRLLAASFLIGIGTGHGVTAEPEAFDKSRFSPIPFNPVGVAMTNGLQFPEASNLFTLASNGVVTRTSSVADTATDTDHSGLSAALKLSLVPTSGGARSDEFGKANTVRRNDLRRPGPIPCGASPNTPEEIVHLVEKAAMRHGVNADLARAIAWTESRYDRVRNSPKGARGPMQLMPATAALLGVSDPCDPASNIEAGIRYLRILLARFKKPLLAIAAYNAGEQAIYDHDGIPPYPETVRYVAAVLNRQMHVDLSSGRDGQQSETVARTDPPVASSVMGSRPVTFVGGVLNF